MVFFGFSNLTAQQLDHRLGVITVQLKPSAEPEKLIETTRLFNGRRTEVKLLNLVSDPFHMWNIGFDQNQINEFDFLTFVRQHPLVDNAQFDYFIEDRNAPNDLFYNFQFHLNNTGQNGGTPGVDLDAELAWESTQGGVTLNGDTIVICIIDESFDFMHEDLFGNMWINHNEIPDDNIDNDGNGYPDDYYGWNVMDLNDDINNNNNPGNHGTQVAGIAGAKGNNNLGVSGINWNVKLMFVTRGYTNSDAIAAYTYPFKMRKKYNQSNGTEGAFVVATNSSWGVNYGTPDDAPAWCAVYDSLGSVGVLSAAASANLPINVDVEGDLPTTCPSNYLVTTTKVDNNDQLPWNTSYGPVSVDLAAFGKDVFTTSIYNQYGNLSGTSAAAPQVAGAIALLYSAPCPSFIALAKSQPQSASLLVKDYILNGTEPNVNFENLTVTGGRLNVFNSLELLMNDCNYTGCYPPYSIVIDGITDYTATIEWLTGLTTSSVDIRYRAIGAPNWISMSNVTDPFQFSNLQPCTNYEFQLASKCGPLTSDYSLSYEFQTSGCCTPPSMFNTSSINENQIVLEWDEVSAASIYRIRYRELNSGSWNIFYQSGLTTIIPGLTSCTTYEFQIQSICNGQYSNFSTSLIVTTLGCGNCIELPYCQMSAGNVSFIWLKKVSLANLDYTSGIGNNGYSNHTDQSAELIQGQSYVIELQSDSALEPVPGIFNVWIDFDQNGIFNDFDELILHSSSPETSSSKIVYVPTGATLGQTRMRVSFLQQNFGPCGQSTYMGEVEDYCVFIDESTECLPPLGVSFTAHENSIDIYWLGNLFVDSYFVKYKEIVDTVWSYYACPYNHGVIDSLTECTDYEFIIHAVCDGEPSLPTQVYYFTTKGCGACLDYDYCFSNAANSNFEWIERIQLSTLDNVSGNNNGYAYFDDQSTSLVIGNYYPLVITPGFSSWPYEEYYMAWIDLNHNGTFESNEVIYDSGFSTSTTAEGIIYIPETTLPGSTRMRVAMKYLFPPFSSCSYNFYGEIEEYCINIVENASQICDYPGYVEIDPTPEGTALISWQEVANAVSYSLRYKKSNSPDPWTYITTGNNFCNLYQLEECTFYQIQVRSICDFGLSEFSTISEFETTCGSVNNNEIDQNVNEIQVFPNPAQDKFVVLYSSKNPSEVQFELYDLTGKLLVFQKMNSFAGAQQTVIEFPEACTAGIYFLKVKSQDQPFSVLKIAKIN